MHYFPHDNVNIASSTPGSVRLVSVNISLHYEFFFIVRVKLVSEPLSQQLMAHSVHAMEQYSGLFVQSPRQQQQQQPTGEVNIPSVTPDAKFRQDLNYRLVERPEVGSDTSGFRRTC